MTHICEIISKTKASAFRNFDATKDQVILKVQANLPKSMKNLTATAAREGWSADEMYLALRRQLYHFFNRHQFCVGNYAEMSNIPDKAFSDIVDYATNNFLCHAGSLRYHEDTNIVESFNGKVNIYKHAYHIKIRGLLLNVLKESYFRDQ